MKNISLVFVVAILLSGMLVMSCDDNSPYEPPGGGGNGNGTGSTTIPPVFEDFWDDVTISKDGEDIIIETKNIPHHRSPYFDQSSGNFVTYNGSNPSFEANEYKLQEKTIKFKIPSNPDIAVNNEDTPHGSPIGIAVNGVVFYSGFTGPNGEPMTTEEFNSLDQHYGHADSDGVYHYHLPPQSVLDDIGPNSILGMMLDGYAIYGPIENGLPVSNFDLDEFHGHFHDTYHQPDSIYHYHINAEAPYLIGEKFYGVPGAVEY